MKRAVLLCTVAGIVLLLSISGCKRRARPEHPPTYDPELDGGPPLPAIHVDPNFSIARTLLADVKSPTPSGRPAKTKRTTPTPTDPIEQAKQVIRDMLTAAHERDVETVLSFFSETDYATFRKLLEVSERIPTKAQQLEQLVSTRLGTTLPESAKSVLSVQEQTGGKTPLEDMGTSALKDFKFTLQGEQVIAVGPDGMPLTLKKEGQTWKVHFPQELRIIIPVMTEMFEATEKLADEAIAGINNGSITKDNLEGEIKKLSRQHVEPVMAKFLGMMMTMSRQAQKPPEKGPPGIEKGKTYRVSHPISFSLVNDPSQVGPSTTLDTGSRIKIIKSIERNQMWWYQGSATDPRNKSVGTGWLNELDVDALKPVDETTVNR